METLKQVFFIAVLAIVTVGCGSDDDNNGSQTVEQMLMSGKWYQEKRNGFDITPCEKKSFIHFFDGNKIEEVEFYEGSSNCDIARSDNGTFVLIGDSVIDVNYENDGFSGQFHIESITPSELVLEMYGSLITFDKTEG